MNMNQCPSPEEEIPLRDRPIQEVADVLQETLGQRIPAYVIQERDPRRIGVFARGEDVPDEDTEKTLRGLAEVVDTLSEHRATPALMRAWMIGNNPLLDTAPAQALHRGHQEAAVNAAKWIGADGID